MTATGMNPTTAEALRAQLVDYVAASRPRNGRRRVRTASIVLLIAGVAGTSTAVAVDQLRSPGDDLVTQLTDPVNGTRTGSGVVELEDAPPGADHLSIQLVCMSPGTFVVKTGPTLTCGAGEVGTATSWTEQLRETKPSFSIETDSGARWRVSISFASVTTTPWETNAAGETFGIPNKNGTPDLVAVTATNGRNGFVHSADLLGPVPANPAEALEEQAHRSASIEFPVVTSDGVTQIGKFVATRGPAAP